MRPAPRRVHSALSTLVLTGLLAASVLGAAGPAAAATTDTQAAALASLAIEPALVDASLGPVPVVVTARLTDAGSGVARVLVHLGGSTSPVDLHALSGTNHDGLWSGVALLPGQTTNGPVSAYLSVTDIAGNPAELISPSAVHAADAVPAAPGQLAAVGDTTGAIHVTWTSPADNGSSPVTSFALTATPAPGDPATGAVSMTPADTDHAATLAGLAIGSRYVIQLAARNSAGLGPAASTDTMTGGTASTPSAPTDVTATPGPSQLGLGWAAPPADGGSPVTGYDVTSPSGVTHLGPDIHSMDVTGLANGAPRTLTVQAVSASGVGLAANVTGRPRAVPGAPGIGAVSGGDGSALVHWTAPTSDGGSPPYAYEVRASNGLSYVLPASARSAQVGGLANGTAASFTVTAVNAAGEGLPSARSASVTPRLPGALVVIAQPSASIGYGVSTVVRVDLRTLGDVSVSGRSVSLLARVRPSTTWRTVATAVTDATGLVTLHTVLPATSALKVRHIDDVIHAVDVAVRSVGVATRVTAAPNALRIRQGMALVVRGGITPAHPIGSLVRLQRLTSTGWLTVATGHMVTSRSYQVGWRPTAVATYAMRVLKPADADHLTGGSGHWLERIDPENFIDVARAIRSNLRITLATVHDSGVHDLATAAGDLLDLAGGYQAHRSSYQNAPGGRTPVDLRVLSAIRRMGQLGTITVSEVAGGSHAPASGHYSGRAVDITVVNGNHVGGGGSYSLAVNTCRAFGASQVFSPSNDPYGGHGNHVHCGWS